MVMQCKIPPAMREQLSQDPFMKTCIIEKAVPFDSCKGRITWQHAFQYASKRQNQLYTLLPMCEWHHQRQASFRPEQESAMRARIKHFNAEADFRKKYSKSTLLSTQMGEMVNFYRV